MAEQSLEQPVLQESDYRILDRVDTAVRQGTQVWEWWKSAHAKQSYQRKLDLIRSEQEQGNTYAFFDEAPVDGKPLPVMGVVQEIFFDQARVLPGEDPAEAALALRDQIRELALRYYHRVMKLARPQLYPDLAAPHLPKLLRDVSWWPTEGLDVAGFGCRQLYYKRLGSGEVGAFAEEEQDRIVDTRTVGREYEWVVMQFDFYKFQVSLKPFGVQGPQLIAYPSERPYVVMTPELIVDQDDPSPDLLGSYGPGYCFLAHQDRGDPGVIAFGPDKVEPAFDVLQFEIDKRGRIVVRSVFVIPQPTRILDVPLNPLLWGFGLANLFTLGAAHPLLSPLADAARRLPGGSLGFDPVLGSIDALNRATGGWSGRELGLSRETIGVDALFIHCAEIYDEILSVLQTWSRVPDWLDPEAIPEWVQTGRL